MLLAGRRADGTEFPVEVSLSPIDRAGELRVVATVRDITDRLALDAHVYAVVDTIGNATDGLFLFPADTMQFEYVNRGAVNQLGYTKAELLTMTPIHIKPEFTRASFRDLLDPLVAGHVPSITFTTVHRRRDGTDVPVEVILDYPEPLRAGGQRFVVALVRNITERVAAEESHRRAADAFRAAFDRAPVAVAISVVSEHDITLTQVNAAFGELVDRPVTELLGRSVSDLVEPGQQDIVDAARTATVSGNVRVGSIETVLRRPDGTGVPVWVHAKMLQTEPGRSPSVLTHVVDLSERRRAETEREQARRWTESLAEIRAAVLDERPLDEILRVVCQRAQLLVDAKGAFVTMLDDARRRHRVVAADGAETRSGVPDDFAVDEAVRRVLEGEAFHVTNLDEAPEVDPVNRTAFRARDQSSISGLMVRIAFGVEAVALLFVISEREAAFTDEVVARIEALAAEAATAIELDQARRQRTVLALVEDRERTARDLHDLVIQRLFATGISVQAILPSIGDNEARDRLQSVVGDLDKAISDLRSSIFHLGSGRHPNQVAERLQVVTRDAAMSLGFEPTMHVAGDPSTIPESIVDELAAVATEALANVARHAVATACSADVVIGDGRVELTVADDGVGIEASPTAGLGLGNLAKRAEQLGGNCVVERRPDGGTAVVWTVPI